MREVAHYAQEISSGKFQRYDFGKTKNVAKYGQKNPPEIDITGISNVPVAMFVGLQDPFSDVVDAKWAYDSIPSSVHFQTIENCDHSSYLMGKDMSFMEDVKELLAKYNHWAKQKA